MKLKRQSGSSTLLIKNILAMASGNTIAQVIVVLFAPIITRVFSPEVFGIQGVFLAAVGLLSPLVCLRLPMAIVLAEDEQEVRQIERISLLVAFVGACLVCVFLTVFGNAGASALGLGEVGALVYMLPIALVLVGLQEIADYKAARAQRFKALSVVAVAQALVINASKVIGGLFAPVAPTLVSLSTAGPGLHALLLAKPFRRGPNCRPIPKAQARYWRTVLMRHRDFPLMRTPTDVLNAASQTLPVILLATLFSPLVAGLYTLSRSVLNVPSNIIGNAIGSVYYEHFARLSRGNERIFGIALRSTAILLIGPGALIVCVCFMAPAIFAFAFGEEWRGAGEYARWMSIWIAVALANVPSVRLAPVIGRQRELLIANILMLILRVGSIVVVANFSDDPIVAVVAYSVVSALTNLGLITWMLCLTWAHDKRVDTSLVQVEAGD